MSSIRRGKKITNKENDKNEFNGGADWVVLITGLDVSDEHGRARNLLKAIGDLVG